jgi:hypothetical protein
MEREGYAGESLYLSVQRNAGNPLAFYMILLILLVAAWRILKGPRMVAVY